MLRYFAVSRCLLMFLWLICLSILSVSAQQLTPNPIFVPLNSTIEATAQPIASATVTPMPSSTESIATETPSSMPTPTDEFQIEKEEHHYLQRPIEIRADKVHWVDRTYPYGSTQWGNLEVHLGVEFVNPRFTPIYASHEGTVIFAGLDAEFPIGPYENYYGIAIIIAHDVFSLDGEQVFTLYGHLDRIEVHEGQVVERGERIGRIGSSGIATGAHLHFEVRAGEPFDYRFTRNPELWLQHYVDHGMIVGYVHDSEGNPIFGQRLVVRSDDVTREVFTYASERVNSDPVWQENFTVGDLPTDEYEIVMLNEAGLVIYRNTIFVEPYKTTFVDIVIDDD